MLRHSKLALCLWIVAVALVALPVSGTHLHLCADGREAAASLHLFDASPHHASVEPGSDDSDQDIEISGVAVFKKSSTSGSLFPAIFAFVLVLMLPRLETLVPFIRAVPLATSPRLFLTPPFRGPPL